jgi:hypothetical protein
MLDFTQRAEEIMMSVCLWKEGLRLFSKGASLVTSVYLEMLYLCGALENSWTPEVYFFLLKRAYIYPGNASEIDHITT